MRSLFIKIFFWFWLANTLGAGAMMLTMWARSGVGPPMFHAMARDRLAMYGRGAVAVLEHDGPEAMRQHVRHARNEPDHPVRALDVFLFDDSGGKLTEGPAPEGARELAMAAIQDDVRDSPVLESSRLHAVRVFGASGRPYAVLGQSPGGPPGLPGPNPRFFAMRLFAVIIPGGVICYGLSRYLTAPLRRLRAAAQQLARGDLTVRAGARVGNRRDEIGQLGRDFDFMAERVESLMSAQRRLLRDMSHELRSPLARLNIALGLVGEHDDPEARAAIDRIESEAERLEELIGGLLTLSRLEGAEMTESEPIALPGMVQEIAADATFEANTHNRSVRISDLDNCTVTGSPQLLRSAIENVVRNAVHHTAEGTEVEIALRRVAGHGDVAAVISVRDHGPGVPAGAIEEMFRPFYRVGDARSRETGGTGLGLAIADRAVGLHGGAIKAANATDGGLVVELRLPATEGSDELG